MEKSKCLECGGKLAKKQVNYFFLGQNLGRFEAEVCTKCGEQVFSEEIAERISDIAKERGLWGLVSRTKINKVGNSIAVTVTKEIAKFLNLKKGEQVIIYPEDKHRLIVEIS